MNTGITVFHVRDRVPAAVEQALSTIFAREERTRALRLEGTYSAVLARVSDEALEAGYRYLILRPHEPSRWTALLEVGNRTEGLEAELSTALDGADVFKAFVYDDGLSGYVVAREGREVDRYVSDPTYYADATEGSDETDESAGASPADLNEERGHPERFADLLPAGTSPEDFARVVLRPGYWEDRDREAGGAGAGPAEEARDKDGDEDEGDLVDEVDRMRCVGLALELWAPDEYPLAQPPEEIPNAVAGPAIVVAYA